MTAVRVTHPGSAAPAFVPLDSLAFWEARGWTAVPGPNVGDPGFPGVVARFGEHEADEAIHGGGQRLGFARLSADSPDVATTTYTAVPGLSITFVAPDAPYVVRLHGRLLVPANAGGSLALYGQIGAATPDLFDGDAHFTPTGGTTIKKVTVELPVPGPAGTSPNTPNWHRPNPGDEVTYHARVNRLSGSGNVKLSVDLPTAFGGKASAFIEAVTRSAAA